MTITEENKKRVELLHIKYNLKIINYINTLTNDIEESEDLYQNMLLFLLENPNPKIWDKDTFNIAYIFRIVYSRFINRVNFLNKRSYEEFNEEIVVVEDEEYNYDDDKKYETKLEILLQTINEAKINKIDKYIKEYEKAYLYKMPIKMLAKKVGVSDNTLYTHFRKIQEIIEMNVKNKVNSLIINE